MNAGTGQAFQYDPFSQEAMRDPHSFYPRLREEYPAYFIPEYDAWVFSRYEDVWSTFRDSVHFSEAEGQVFSRAVLLEHHRGAPPPHKINPVKDMFTFLDPPEHTRIRQALAPPFLVGSVRKLEAMVTKLVRKRLDQLLPKGRFDLNGDLGSHVSMTVTMHVMGLELDDPVHVNALINRMVARDPNRPGMTEEGLAARNQLMDILRSEVARRRSGRGMPSMVIDPMLEKDLIGRPLTDDEIATDMLAILVGGAETVPKVFADGLYQLQQNPDQLAEVAADPAGNAKAAVDEMLRYCAPAQWFGRTVKKACQVGGVDLELGQRVILLIAAANRDPREFENADRFIWNRTAKRMLSFGVGPHFCIGIHVARLELQVLVREFLARVKEYRVHPDEGIWPASEFQVGWLSLPVTVRA